MEKEKVRLEQTVNEEKEQDTELMEKNIGTTTINELSLGTIYNHQYITISSIFLDMSLFLEISSSYSL